MAEKEVKGFYFNKLRSTADTRKMIVVQGYAADGYLDDVRPRAAVFVGGHPVKALKCELKLVKLPPIYVRRRDGNIMSYLALFFVDLSSVREYLRSRASSKLVVIGERSDKSRIMIYKASLDRVYDKMYTFSFNVDEAYIEDGNTVLKGWLGGNESTIIRVEGIKTAKTEDDPTQESVGVDGSLRVGNSDSTGALFYQVQFTRNREIIVEYPEIPTEYNMGFHLNVEGEYKKLRVTMSDGEKKDSKIITVGKTSGKGDTNGDFSRYSEKVMRNLKNYGLRETANKVLIRMSLPYVNLNKQYNKWINQVSPDEADLKAQAAAQANMNYRPKLSVLIPLYETDEDFLDELVSSLQNQSYPEWEACFSDGSRNSSRLRKIIKGYAEKDKRIKFIDDKEGPLGISENTNQAFKLATGDFLVLGDHDDLFTPDAFYRVVKELNDSSDDVIDVLYTDEDKTNFTAERRFDPTIKPNYNPEFLESCNYITHMFVVRSSLLDEVGLFDESCDGAQDYDFILKCTEVARRVQHINKITYSWRINENSTAGNPGAKIYAYDSGVKALQSHYDRMGIKAVAEIGDHLGYYHTRYEIEGSPVLYVVVVNSDDEKYKLTVDSIESKSDFRNIKYVRVDAGNGINLAGQMNMGLREVESLVSEDEETPEWEVFVAFIEAGVTMMGEDGLSGMLSYIYNRRDVAAIGGKIYLTNGTVSHAGVILEADKKPEWKFMNYGKFRDMYFNSCAYTALRRGVTMYGLADLRKFGEFSDRYSGECTVIEYTYKLSRAHKKCIYNANAEFQIKAPRSKDADEIFEDSAITRADYKLLLTRNKNIARLGDLYYPK